MLTQLRAPADPQPRESAADPIAPILICLLGSFRLLRDGRPLDRLVTGKSLALLSVLALHRDGGVSREALLETLWPARDAAQASVSLHSLVYGLGRRLRDHRHAPTPVVFANGYYTLNAAAGISTDVARFDAHVAAGARAAAAGQTTRATDQYERAVALYRGDLMDGADIGTVIERERLRASFLSVLAWLADTAYQDGVYAAALVYAQRLLSCDPCREDAHRVVMRAHVHRGERAQALRHYRLCEQVLRREFDAAPEALTTALFERIRCDPATL